MVKEKKETIGGCTMSGASFTKAFRLHNLAWAPAEKQQGLWLQTKTFSWRVKALTVSEPRRGEFGWYAVIDKK